MQGNALGWTLPAMFALALGILGVHERGLATAQAKEPAQNSATAADKILGEWWTEDREGRVRFERGRGGTYRGVATYRAPRPATEDNPDTDLHNPNPKRRGRSTIGIVLIWDLKYEDGRYKHGYVYNPRNGGTYGFEVVPVDQETLKVRGFMGIRLFGANQTWKRYHGS